jgi:hypothetical protein
MSESTFKFGGLAGLIVLVAVAAVVFYRAGTIGEVDDPKLDREIRSELRLRLGERTGRSISNLDRNDPDAVNVFIQNTDPDAIEIHSTRVSKPVLSFGTRKKTVVRVEYRLPGDHRRTEYWEFKKSLGGWRYRRETSAVSYYLNFL